MAMHGSSDSTATADTFSSASLHYPVAAAANHCRAISLLLLVPTVKLDARGWNQAHDPTQ
jgi:hypothetical protein